MEVAPLLTGKDLFENRWPNLASTWPLVKLNFKFSLDDLIASGYPCGHLYKLHREVTEEKCNWE
jgi:hypothetical protein